MKKFSLVNPYIKGSFDNEFSEKSANVAAQTIWENLSKFMSKNLPQFAFTIRNMENSKLYHYKVNEEIESGSIKYKISQISNVNKDQIDKMLKNIEEGCGSCGEEKEQDGGKHKKHKKSKSKDDDSSSSSASSSSSYHIYHHYSNGPISYLNYYPLVYEEVKLSFPTWITSVSPYSYLYF